MRSIGYAIEKTGIALAIVGGVCFAGIFLIVILNGSWPEFLEPVRRRYAIISEIAGGFAFVIELALFLGPGILLAITGEKLKNSN